MFLIVEDFCRLSSDRRKPTVGTKFANPDDMNGHASQYVVITFSSQPSVAFFLKGVLDCAGFQATAVSSTIDDLDEAVRRNHADVIVYDLSYPFQDNWRALEEWRQRTVLQGIPVVITTSEAQALHRTLGISAAIEIFKRPDDVTELRRIVRQTIETGVHAA